MDKRKSLLNISVSVSFKILSVACVILTRKVLINTCGNETVGLNALYLSIIGILSLAELGVGTAITFCMYKPIVEENHDQVSALYHLFRKLYAVIGIIVLAVGLLLIPFLPYLAKDYARLDIDLYGSFLLMLVSVVLTYFFGAKTALINAYKNNYITNAIYSCGMIFEYFLQIAVLLVTKSFSWYLACKILSVLLQWGATSLYATKHYDRIIVNRQKVNKESKTVVVRSIRAMFMHKVGSLMATSVDSLIISVFVGVIALGEFSNYTTILYSLDTILALIFRSLTSVVGHVYVSQSKEMTRKYGELFHMLNFIVGAVFFLGYYAIIDNLSALLFAEELVISRSVSVVITLNGFVHFMRYSVSLFRDASGAFYNDRWVPLIEGLVNLVLSVILVRKMGVAGVIIATIVTNLLLCHVVEPYVVYHNSFEASPAKHYVKNYTMIALFAGLLVCMDKLMISNSSQWVELFTNGCISVLLSLSCCALVVAFDADTRAFARKVLKE